MLISFYLDMIPVLLAAYALYGLSSEKLDCTVFLSRLIIVVFIICQTTWIHSYLNQFQMVVTFMDYIWTVFNTLVMILILRVSSERK